MTQRKDTSGKSNGRAPNGKEPERLTAYILSLTLENVRCFGPKATLDLSDRSGKPARWTIILGVNGTGKTTLLQSLVGFQLLSNPPPMLSELRSRDPMSDTERSITPSRFALWVLEGSFSFVRGNAGGNASWKAQYAISHELAVTPTMLPTVTTSVSPKGDEFKQSHCGFSPWCCAYGAGRRLGSASLITGEVNDPTATLFSDRAELRNAEEWLIQLDYAAKSDKHDKDAQHRLTQAKELLLSIMPEDEITDIRFDTTGGPNPKARVEFKTRSGWVPLRQLGYGYQTLITWVADLVSRMAERYPDSKNPLAEPAVVLVDEIDLHLHPKWQRKLMGFLTQRFPNTQFIATAHSPLVVQAAADANLAVLRWEGDHVVIDNEVDNIRNWRIDQILTSDLFGLETARPPQIEAWMMERKALLTKPRMTAADKRRVEELEEKIGPLPVGETAQEIEEREKMLKLLDNLAKERKPAS
jgi:energy-coupling factor transporter ATP-binding protein EcfA2